MRAGSLSYLQQMAEDTKLVPEKPDAGDGSQANRAAERSSPLHGHGENGEHLRARSPLSKTRHGHVMLL